MTVSSSEEGKERVVRCSNVRSLTRTHRRADYIEECALVSDTCDIDRCVLICQWPRHIGTRFVAPSDRVMALTHPSLTTLFSWLL